jgi:hypothetical protein
VSSEHDFSYEGTFAFDASPEELWAALQRTDLFETWWPWMRDVNVEGEVLTPGSVLSFHIDPPVPYRMGIRVDVIESDPCRSIRGRVSGDLSGWGYLEMEALDDRSIVVTRWDVETSNGAIRAAIRVARPLLLWAQQWAVESSLKGFRRYLVERSR